MGKIAGGEIVANGKFWEAMGSPRGIPGGRGGLGKGGSRRDDEGKQQKRDDRPAEVREKRDFPARYCRFS